MTSWRIRVEHGIKHLKNRRPRLATSADGTPLDTILPAVAGLVSSQEQALRLGRPDRRPRALPAGTAR